MWYAVYAFYLTFLLYIVNLVQQIRRAEHNGNESRSVIFYLIKKDLRTNFEILAKNHETWVFELNR